MNQESTIFTGSWQWGALWTLYAYLYGMYFGHLARRLNFDAKRMKLPGSPERLLQKQSYCYRFAFFMLIPTLLEAIRSSYFTAIVIVVLPAIFGIWVMKSIWQDVLHSKVSASKKKPTPHQHDQ